MKIQNLVVSINKKGFELYSNLNIKCDAIIANQSNSNSYQEKLINSNRVKLITTNTKGVGINRNLALLYSDADICVLTDDDMKYEDNYLEIIKQAFEKIPTADIIVFNIDTVGKDVGRRKNKKIKRISKINFMNYGAARIAFKRKSIIRENIWFSLLFGGGSIYSSGEDTLFLAEALNKKLKIYTYPQTIATVNQENSTWFNGYDEKFFFDKGALIGQIHPKTKYLFALIYFPLRFKSNIPFRIKQKLLYKGMNSYKKGIDYNYWENLRNNQKGK